MLLLIEEIITWLSYCPVIIASNLLNFFKKIFICTLLQLGLHLHFPPWLQDAFVLKCGPRFYQRYHTPQRNVNLFWTLTTSSDLAVGQFQCPFKDRTWKFCRGITCWGHIWFYGHIPAISHLDANGHATWKYVHHPRLDASKVASHPSSNGVSSYNPMSCYPFKKKKEKIKENSHTHTHTYPIKKYWVM